MSNTDSFGVGNGSQTDYRVRGADGYYRETDTSCPRYRYGKYSKLMTKAKQDFYCEQEHLRNKAHADYEQYKKLADEAMQEIMRMPHSDKLR